MEPLTNLVGLKVTLGATLASEHDTRRGHAAKTGKPDELPAHAHQVVGYWGE
jgi:hypothetical protein